MKELLDKISSYNLFNYFLPGILFVCILKYFTNYNFTLENNLASAFLCYFYGMTICGFGEVIIEPLLKRFKFVIFAPYNEFVSAVKKDEKIILFSEINNTLRNIVALFIILILLKGYNYYQIRLNIPDNISILIGVAFTFLIFLFWYQKMTSYIRNRIKEANK